MKKILLLLLTTCISTIFSHAQLLPPNQPEQNSCDALVLCGRTFHSPYAYQGIGTSLDLNGSPCGAGEDNAMWMRLDINTPGTIVFTIAPVIPQDDYDFFGSKYDRKSL